MGVLHGSTSYAINSTYELLTSVYQLGLKCFCRLEVPDGWVVKASNSGNSCVKTLKRNSYETVLQMQTDELTLRTCL